MATVTPMSFSRDAEYLAYSGPDGVLKLWETSSGLLKQQYTPSSHLSATCSCLSWSSKRRSSETPRKKKKRKSSEASGIASGGDELELIALGATSGDVLLYSVTHGDLHTQMTGGHTEEVTGLCWNDAAGLLYSCSTDKHIVEWNVGSNRVQQKWKGDKGRLYSVCLCSQNHLLSAGRSIKLWDLHTKEILKTFTGHATEVFRLLPITSHSSLESTDSIENTYFLSAAVNDRFLNVWQIDTSSKEKSALATFALSDEPVLLDCSQLDDDSVLLTVTTKSGQLLVFQHALNGKLRKPIKPRLTIQAATSSDKDGTPLPIPVLAACIRQTSDRKLLVAHGSFLKPVFEYISHSSKEAELCLIREDTTHRAASSDLNVTKIKTPSISKNVTLLSPGVMAPEAPSQDTGKRKKRTTSVGEMAMSDRLNAISIETNNESKTLSEPPKADTLAVMLIQGLQSRDKKILSNVLLHTDDAIVLNTVRRLPVHVVIPFVRELSVRIQNHAQGGRHLVKWMKSVIMHHTSYLMTFPDIIEVFSTLYQKMDTRVATFHKLSKIKGKLDLILSQISSQGEEETDAVSSQQPLLLYHEESSDEDLGLDDIMQSHSESEDNWEDLSDMDTQEQNGDDDD